MLTPEQKQLRMSGLGGSDAAPAVGLSPWKTPLALYLDKTEGQEESENDDMYRGTLLEPVVRQMYCDATGRSVIVPDETIRHPKYPWMLASLDGITQDRDIIPEFKTARDKRGWGDPGTAEIPVVYLCQLQHYLMVTGAQRAELAVLFGQGFEFAIYPVDADAEFQDLLLEGERKFWEECVLRRCPPDPTNGEDIRRRWPVSRPVTTSASLGVYGAALQLQNVKSALKLLEELEKRDSDELKLAMGEAEALSWQGEIIATWKSVKASPTFDRKRFQSEHPELYAQYLNEPAPQRRLLLKGNAECLQTGESTTTISEAVQNWLNGQRAPDSLPNPETAD